MCNMFTMFTTKLKWGVKAHRTWRIRANLTGWRVILLCAAVPAGLSERAACFQCFKTKHQKQGLKPVGDLLLLPRVEDWQRLARGRYGNLDDAVTSRLCIDGFF